MFKVRQARNAVVVCAVIATAGVCALVPAAALARVHNGHVTVLAPKPENGDQIPVKVCGHNQILAGVGKYRTYEWVCTPMTSYVGPLGHHKYGHAWPRWWFHGTVNVWYYPPGSRKGTGKTCKLSKRNTWTTCTVKRGVA